MKELKKRKVKRSPNFPVISLEEAIINTEKLYKADGRAGSLRETVYKHLGYKGEHGASRTVFSALKKFGLIREEGNQIYLTKDSEIIFMASETEKKKSAIKRCALKPEIYRKIFEEYSESGLPSDSTLKDRLIFDFEFNEKSVDGFIINFKKTLEYAEIIPGSSLESDNEDGNESQGSFDENVLDPAIPAKIKTGKKDGFKIFMNSFFLYCYALWFDLKDGFKIFNLPSL